MLPIWEESVEYVTLAPTKYLILFTLFEYDITLCVIKLRAFYSKMTGIVKKSYTMALHGERMSLTQDNELQTFRGHSDIPVGGWLDEQIAVDNLSVSVLRQVTMFYYIYLDWGWNQSNIALYNIQSEHENSHRVCRHTLKDSSNTSSWSLRAEHRRDISSTPIGRREIALS